MAVLVLISGWRVTKEAIHILMEGTPKNVNIDEVTATIENLPGITNIHDLHVWSITSGRNAFSGHVVVEDDISFAESQDLLREIECTLASLKIGHVTVQLEKQEHSHKESVTCQGEDEGQELERDTH